MIVLMLSLAGCIAEAILLGTPLWRYRTPLSAVLACYLALSCIVAAVMEPGPAVYCMAVFHCYRIIGLGRIMQRRLHAHYLLAVCRRTALWLGGLQVVSLAIPYDWLLANWHWLWLLAGVQCLAGIVHYTSTRRQSRTTQPYEVATLRDAELPTLTVAIPARNETAELMACLETLVAADYPKLEILVLDEKAHGKTAEIVRQFAHQGVRFVPGDAPRLNWLAKNQAYQYLTQAANGDVILFCGVDIRFTEQSLRQAVNQLMGRHKQMLCIVPQNQSAGTSAIQPMRYAWEYALPRRLFNRPPALSSCWLIKRSALKHLGGFAAVTRMVVPEAYFARELVATDGYSFVRSSSVLAVQSAKPLAAQRETAIRVRYPQLHKRIELVFVAGLYELAALSTTPLLVISCLALGQWSIATLGALGLCLQLAAYSAIATVTYGRFRFGQWLLLPYAVLVDVYTMHLSMWRYEFGTVLWKNRDVTPTVMHSRPHAPQP